MLGFYVLLRTDLVLAETTDQLDILGYSRALRVLSVLLGLSLAQVEV